MPRTMDEDGKARTRQEAEALRRLDKAHFWHPFTQMRQWEASPEDPLILVRGEGAWLEDLEGNRYLDGNSSIWTNVHGHNHPRLTGALHAQLDQLAHTSALGFSNEPAIRLAAKLAEIAPGEGLKRVFFSDDGSTAMECACKMALQFWQLKGHPERTHFLSFDGAYHGDTIGAASLGGIGTFNDRFASWGFATQRLAHFEELERVEAGRVAAVTIEPLIQGAAGMRVWPEGMLRALRHWCDRTGALLILDEVMTGFGRTGTMFACEREGVAPDLMALAKGLTGGYLPLAATLATERIYDAFLGDYAELKTFFYGHSYCGNPLGCAAALANLAVFEEERTLDRLPATIEAFGAALAELRKACPEVREVRQVGLMAGVELGDAAGEPLDWREQTGARVCRSMRAHGVLTRAILDTIVLMPPLCVTADETQQLVEAVGAGVREVLGGAEA